MKSTASKWITSLEKWGKYEKHILNTDYLIRKIEDECINDPDGELDKDDIRRFADECELFYYASYGNEYPKKIDGEWVMVNEDEEWSNEMREEFEEWIQTV